MLTRAGSFLKKLIRKLHFLKQNLSYILYSHNKEYSQSNWLLFIVNNLHLFNIRNTLNLIRTFNVNQLHLIDFTIFRRPTFRGEKWGFPAFVFFAFSSARGVRTNRLESPERERMRERERERESGTFRQPHSLSPLCLIKERFEPLSLSLSLSLSVSLCLSLSVSLCLSLSVSLSLSFSPFLTFSLSHSLFYFFLSLSLVLFPWRRNQQKREWVKLRFSSEKSGRAVLHF